MGLINIMHCIIYHMCFKRKNKRNFNKLFLNHKVRLIWILRTWSCPEIFDHTHTSNLYCSKYLQTYSLLFSNYGPLGLNLTHSNWSSSIGPLFFSKNNNSLWPRKYESRKNHSVWSNKYGTICFYNHSVSLRSKHEGCNCLLKQSLIQVKGEPPPF